MRTMQPTWPLCCKRCYQLVFRKNAAIQNPKSCTLIVIEQLLYSTTSSRQLSRQLPNTKTARSSSTVCRVQAKRRYTSKLPNESSSAATPVSSWYPKSPLPHSSSPNLPSSSSTLLSPIHTWPKRSGTRRGSKCSRPSAHLSSSDHAQP